MLQQPGNVNELVEHLFRHEAGKLSATLSRAFGLRSLEAVEDMVQDTLVAALKSWSFSGVPTDPTAWLHRVARNKALDYLRNQQRKPERSLSECVEAPFSSGFLQNEPVYLPSEIADSQLRMIYACCQPGIAPESQVAIILKTLCGFSVAEIANAFLSNEATIEKRL
jgi:RNA polymerase sigma factor (sigma-70 family)